MKRDMDLIRKLLLAIEADGPESKRTRFTIDGYSPEETDYNTFLLLDAGLVEGQQSGVVGTKIPRVIVIGLTWDGHEFLDAAKDEGLWKQATSKMRKPGGALTFEVLKALLIKFTKESVGLE